MTTFADKKQKNTSVSNAIIQKKNNSISSFQFEDNRPESILQMKLKNTIENNASSDEVTQLQRNRRKWTPQQRAQSEKFWKKKNARMERQKNSRINRRLNEIRGNERIERQNVAANHVVAGPAGHHNPMPDRAPGVQDVMPRDNATMNYGQMMENITGFLHPDHPVRSVYNDGGAQFIQNFDQTGTRVTRRVGVDVEPSAHVQGLRPHINLQTQHNGQIQGGALADPHTPVRESDPFPTRHPLHGLSPEEKRKFMERYLHSSGINVQRP